jgi:hypothetical protein
MIENVPVHQVVFGVVSDQDDMIETDNRVQLAGEIV